MLISIRKLQVFRRVICHAIMSRIIFIFICLVFEWQANKQLLVLQYQRLHKGKVVSQRAVSQMQVWQNL